MKQETPFIGSKGLIGFLAGAFIFAAIGILLVFNVFAAGNSDHTESFTVSDPSVDKSCTLDEEPTGDGVTVEYYDGTGWSSVSDDEYFVSGRTVTVDASAMD